jgi:hypothetical protein
MLSKYTAIRARNLSCFRDLEVIEDFGNLRAWGSEFSDYRTELDW